METAALEKMADATVLSKPDVWGFQPHHAEWIAEFVRAHGRAPRVLGIGNIANNGFRNAVVMREHGIECDVLCYNYFHIMGCPEWECAYFDAADIDEMTPIWSKVELGGYERPRWFAQGHLATALDYLIAFREGAPETEGLWDKLVRECESGGAEAPSTLFQEAFQPHEADLVAFGLARSFRDLYPNRRDRLNDKTFLATYRFLVDEIPRLQRLFACYDVIIGYSTDGLFPLLSGVKDYIAYEHGTIRAIPFQRDLQGQLCALTYGLANRVLITNCDNILAVNNLDLRRYAFTPHAILETWADAAHGTTLREQLLRKHNADFLIFHPSRQHWSFDRNGNWDKGNDIFIDGFARFQKERRPGAFLILIEWGQMVRQTRELIEKHGIADRVVWLKPIPLRVLGEYIAASDVLSDQFTIGAWGGIMPIGLMLGTPTLIYLNEEMHRWCFDELPPILNARTPELVFDRLVEMQDTQNAAAISEAGRKWYRRYHSTSVVAGRFVDAIMAVISGHDADGPSVAKSEFAANNPSDWTRTKLRDVKLQIDLLERRMQRLGAGFDTQSAKLSLLLEFVSQRTENIGGSLDQVRAELILNRTDLMSNQNEQAHQLREMIAVFERRYRILRLICFPAIWVARRVKRIFAPSNRPLPK